jgi:hypothetical protein
MTFVKFLLSSAVVNLNDVLQLVPNRLVVHHTIEQLQVGDDALEALVSAFDHAPSLHPLDLVHLSQTQIAEKLLKLLFSAIVHKLALKQTFELFLVGLVNELIEFLFVNLQCDLAQVFFVEPVLEGRDKANGLCEVPLQHDLLEELDLLAIGNVTDLSRAACTSDSRSRVR